MAQLEIERLTKRFGGLVAIDSLDLSIEQGALHGIIGPNGAGKTTLFSMISGTLRASSGRIAFEGHDITGLRAHEIVRRGLARTFQRSALFHDFSVLENVLLAMHLQTRATIAHAIIGRGPRFSMAEVTGARKILDVVGLTEHEQMAADALPLGHQRSLGIAMALATAPRLLMLDEPAAGMNPTESANLSRLIRTIRDELGLTVLLVEHDMQTVMSVCERITVINFGRKLAEAAPLEIAADPRVIEAYLGSDADEVAYADA